MASYIQGLFYMVFFMHVPGTTATPAALEDLCTLARNAKDSACWYD